MAGAGYKLFNTGDVLTAAQVNTYLQEQTVMVFANAAARTTALSSVLAEGMVSYLKDTNATEVYDGSAWVGIGNSGDITSVAAGVGISGGGTSGAVTITNSMATEITAAGDIIVGTGSGTFDNLPIGTTGQVLTADTTVSPYKVKWATAAGGGANWSLLNTGGTALTGSQTITVSGISGVDQIMVLIAGASSASADSYILLRLNGDTASNYGEFWAGGTAGSAYSTNGWYSNYQTATNGITLGKMSGSTTSELSGYALISGCNSSGLKLLNYAGSGSPAGNNGQEANIGGGRYNSSSTISSVSLRSTAGNFDSGTLFVYTTA